jgi:hypothetical protein
MNKFTPLKDYLLNLLERILDEYRVQIVQSDLISVFIF